MIIHEVIPITIFLYWILRIILPYLFRLFVCDHDFIFVRNIYGDEINHAGARSWWCCRKCGKWRGRSALHEEKE